MFKFEKKLTGFGLIVLMFVVFSGCGSETNSSKELELKEKELALKERELELKEKEAKKGAGDKSSRKSKTSTKKRNGKTTSESPGKNKSQPTPKVTATPDSSKKDHFVILGTFPQSDRKGPPELLGRARQTGEFVKLIDTSKYPNLASGEFAVVMGPFTKSVAEKKLKVASAVSIKAYVKRFK